VTVSGVTELGSLECPRCGASVARRFAARRCPACGYDWVARAAAAAHEPAELAVFVGTFSGPSHRVRWDGNALSYERYGAGLEREERIGVTPSREDWLAFWDSLDEARAWTWHGEYEAGVDDVETALQWSLEAGHGDVWVHASGEDRFPPHGSDEPTPAFLKLLDAVRRLLGGMEFGSPVLRRLR
jgi:hypothetical protein